MITVPVRGNNVDSALRALKKKIQREGTFRKYKASLAYLKPSVKRKEKTAEMIRRKRRKNYGD